MRQDFLQLDTSVHQAVQRLEPDVGDIEAMRLMLTGGSVIDWHKAAFATLEDVDRHLALHLLDPHRPEHRRRLDVVFAEAATYVETYLGLRIPRDLREISDVREVFLIASDTRGFRRRQVLCCTILKLMHVMQHLEAADLRLRASISETRLLELAQARVAGAADRMRAEGVNLAAMYGSKKTRMSVVSKLLSKREDVATRIFDKLRYRVVVETQQDLPSALTWMVRHLFPCNQVVPGQCHNNLLDPTTLDQLLPEPLRVDLQALPPGHDADANRNAFSGRSFQMINIVVDLPVRVPDDALPVGWNPDDGDVVYVTMELQVVDAETARNNESGENAHAWYKRRQHEVVRQRLTRGAYVALPDGPAEE